MEKILIERCWFWSVRPGAETYSLFCKNIIPDFKLTDSVPQMIKERFGTVRKLLEYSYFEYSFIDVAMEKCFQTFELALHLKYKQENPQKNRKMEFNRYLTWAADHEHLDLTLEEKKYIVSLRNRKIHLKEDQIHGFVNFKFLDFIGNELINELFDNNSDSNSN